MRPRSVLLAAFCVLTACSPAGNPSALTSPSASSPAFAPTATAPATPTSVATPIPTTTEPKLAVDAFAKVVTTDLVVRSAPGTGKDSDIYGTVDNLKAYVLDGPIHADGYEWWLIVPTSFYQYEPPPSGWVAAGREDERWLTPATVDCQEPPSPDGQPVIASAELVECYGGTDLTLRGTLDGCAAAADVGAWQHGCSLRFCAPDLCETTFDDPRIIVHFEELPPTFEGRIRLTGHFDDSVAKRCGDDDDPLWRLYVFYCRTHFVVSSYRFVD
jgi:hypothetical protein